MWIKPTVIVCDETEYWNGDLVEKAGQIFGVYLFDANQVTYLCELAGSHWLEPLDVAVRAEVPDGVRDDIEELWRQDEQGGYIHVSDVRSMKVFPQPSVCCKKDERDEKWEELIEYYQCNIPNYRLPAAAA